MAADQSPTWICANCGAEHDRNDQPCRECAGERFARLEAPQRVQQSASVRWECDTCGRESARNDGPCANCGGFQYSRVEVTHQETARPDHQPDSFSRDTHYFIGVVLGVIGVLVFPYVFVFVALPEAIAGLFGTSIQNSLGQDVRENPFVSGAFLILQWFGNFIILMLALGFVVGVLLVLA